MTRGLATLRANATPYLIVSGRPVAPAHQQWLHDALPQALLTEWPVSGHFPHLADPDRFAALLATTGRWGLARSSCGRLAFAPLAWSM